MDEITENDIGTDLEIDVEESDVALDVSSATALAIVLKSPAGVESTKTASNVTDGVNGKIHYLTVSGDINEVGVWSYRGKVTFSPSQIFYTRDPREFRVVE